MRSLTLSLPAVVVCLGCGLPPHHDGSGPYRFHSLNLLSHWTENTAAKDATPVFRDSSNVGTVTWRLGKEAPKPRAWAVNDACMVGEGTWRDTDTSPPSHGKTVLTGGPKAVTFVDDRTATAATLDPVLEPGSTWSLKAEGGGLPGFEMGGTLGEERTLTSPAMSAAGREALHLARSAAFTVTWEPGSGDVFLGLFQYTPDANADGYHMIWCRWPASAGTGTVPTDALGTLVEQKSAGFTELYFGSLARQAQTTERVDLEFLLWHGRGARLFVE